LEKLVDAAEAGLQRGLQLVLAGLQLVQTLVGGVEALVGDTLRGLQKPQGLFLVDAPLKECVDRRLVGGASLRGGLLVRRAGEGATFRWSLRSFTRTHRRDFCCAIIS